MLVYGDRVRARDPRGAIDELRLALAEVVRRPGDLARHSSLVGAFIRGSELVQGLADAELEGHGCDARRDSSDAAMAILVELARAIAVSWTSAFVHQAELPFAMLHDLGARPLPDQIQVRRAEGYAFYALYPEAYLAAARAAVVDSPGARRVIGIRSIGTGLAAIVAAATNAPLPATVRPRGDPFRREVMISPALANEWGDPRTKIAIVDEGPGLSGSSFGAVTDLLEERGVATERIECFPGHAGDLGPQASTRHRERWRRLRRHVVHMDALLLHTATPAHALSRWIAELVGPLIGPLEDISAGAWRARRYAREADWPPSVTSQERRKLLARTRDATWVARFVGLGAGGHHALARARALHSAGFTPTVAGLCHGFLVERWLEATTPLDPPYCERERVIDQVGRYLGFRARRFPAGAEDGASIARLLEMLRRNTTLALGPSVATAIDRWDRAASDLEARPQRIEIDGRLHGWEWLVGRDGRLLKSDAIDHHAAHDLIGCQDVTWDVAGAAIELGMSSAEQRRLCAVVGDTAGRVPDPELLALARPCYLAFQLGRHALAIGTSGEAEAARLRAAVDRYASALHAELAR